MCTVVYLPTENGIRLASLRDESPFRTRATPPVIVQSYPISYLSPTDPVAGGTWVGVNQLANVIILLNGAFENHVRKESYYKSRGLIVSELLGSEMPVIEWSMMEMEGIEPYSLIVFTEGNLFRLVWDGRRKHRILLDKSHPYLWSSATLYDTKAREWRNDYFQNWIKENHPKTMSSLLHFFKSVENSQDGFMMNRNEVVKTLSYSFIEIYDDAIAHFNYCDFSTNSHSTNQMELVHNTRNHCMVIP